ncbi:MAG: TonB-dependent receptor, plug [Acidobacteriales bacterium]|nr:TonB-dependent receptor, plug [Terriglobales bacterium]
MLSSARPDSGKSVTAKSGFRLLALSLLLVLSSISVFSQTAARIEGRVQDPSSAVVPKAKVTAVNIKTQAKYETVTSDQGLFVFPVVTPGTYTVTIEAPGFQKQVVNNMEVNVAAVVNQVYGLKVGQATDTVMVEANAVAVQTTDSQLGRNITLRDIDTQPVLGRTPITLSVFQPGVQINPGDLTFSHVNGLRQGSNNSKLDGIDVNDSLAPRLGLSLTANNTDSVGEFRIVTEGGKAEYGRAAGGQVDLITRSGTNKYHGNAFDYLRNTNLNANDYFNKQSGGGIDNRPKFIQNIYGGSFGGPIIHDKTFIFGNFQGRRTAADQVRNRTVLTPQAKAGQFRFLNSAGAITTYDIVANDPRGKGIDPAMASIFGLLPAPNNTDVGDGLNTAGFRFNNPAGSYEDQFTIRGDHNINKNNKAFLRWSWQRNSSIDALNSADAVFPGQPQGTQGGKRWGYSIGDDWTLGSTWVNEFRFGHQSAQVIFARPARLQGPTIISASFTDPISSTFAQGRNSPVNDITDNVTKVYKSHTFKFGVNFRATLQTGFNDNAIYPNVSLSTSAGNSVAIPAALTLAEAGLTATQKSTANTRFSNLYNDVLGRISSVNLGFLSKDLTTFQPFGTTRQRDFTVKESGYYFQDDWKVRRNLSLNLGIRWEYYGMPSEKNGVQGGFANAGQFDGTTTLLTSTVTQTNSWYQKDWNNFAPRFGFAWDIFGDGKTALRGNYGVFFDRTLGAVVNGVDGQTPGFAGSGTINPQQIAPPAGVPNGDVRLADGIPIPPVPAAPITTLPVSNRPTSITLVNPNLRNGYVQSWSVNLQREVAPNTVVELGYVGNRGTKLFVNQDFNQLKIFNGFLGAFQELQAFNANNANLPSANNLLVKMFTNVPVAVCAGGSATVLQSATCAVSKVNATNLVNGNVGTAADTIDRGFNAQYANAGLPQTFLRNYPQYAQVIVGGNGGRSYYDALQISVRRSTGAVRLSANYTYSHNIDNITAEGNGFTSTIDNYNLGRNRADGDFDHRHSINASLSYSLPFGKGQRFGGNMPRWADSIVGGWEFGSLIVLQDGTKFSVSSQRTTTHVTTTAAGTQTNTFADYSGDHTAPVVAYQPDGSVTFFTPADVANFSFPVAGSIGNSNRNGFRGPHFTNVDSSLVKRIKVVEGQSVTFRAEAYNLFNHPNFGGLNTNLNNLATFGKFSSTTGGQGTAARVMQLTLRYDF